MIDWRIMTHDGVPFLVSIHADDDCTPDDADCYTSEDKAAWERGDWRYVTVVVSTEPAKEASVSGVEWGILAGGTVCGWDYVTSDLFGQLRQEATGVKDPPGLPY